MLDGPFNVYFRMQQCFFWNDDINIIFWYGLYGSFNFFILIMIRLLSLLDCLLLDCSILQFSNIMFDSIILLSRFSYFSFVSIYARLDRMYYSRLNLLSRFYLIFRVMKLLQMLQRLFEMRLILPWNKIVIVCMFFHLSIAEIQEYNCLLQILLMQKKIGEISQAFERSKFAQTLSIIEQTLKKNSKQDKKQKQLSNVELKIINWFKVGSLASLGRQHEASIVYQELLTPEGIAIMGKQNPYLLLAISQLFGQNKEKQVLELLEKHFPTFDTAKAYRFYLNTRLFSSLSKLLMKEFATTKNSISQLGQTYCDYLNQINKFGLIEYQRDGWYKYNPDIKANLKLVSMFVEKCIKSSQESKAKSESELLKENILDKERLTAQVQKSKKITHRGSQLKLKMAVNEGRVADAIAIYNSIRPNLKLPFTFLRSIVKLGNFFEHEEQIARFYVKQMEGVFKTNLNFSTYTPLYDYYDEFFNFLKQTALKKGINLQQTVKAAEHFLAFEQLYNFEDKNLSTVLQEYYNSLLSEFAYLTDTKNAQYTVNKKSDYYKICIKGLLLQIVQIAQFLNRQDTKIKYLKEYTTFFSNTLTYPQELRIYWKEIINHEILVNPTEVVNDNQLITQINFRKVWLAVKTVSLDSRQDLFKHYDELMKMYNVRVKEIQKSRKLQKGERYISDQFVIILADYIRSFLQNDQDEAFSQEIISKMVSDLEICVQLSSYNADLKLRLMYFLSLLNHHERLIEVYITNDIKSVQMETLGYWYLKAVLEFGTESKYDHFFERLVKSYQQNQRQTSEYGMKALKAGELDRVQEYLVYRTNILSSYNSLVILFMLFHKNRFENNAHYYLVRINDRINSFKKKQSPLSFNADFKVMNNVLFQDYHFAHLYGLYNHYELLQQQTSVYLHELHLVNTLLERPNDFSLENVESIEKLELKINSFEAASLFNFSDYTFQEEKLKYNVETSKKSLERAGKHLDVFKHLMAVRISNIRLFSHLLNSIKTLPLSQEEAIALQTAILANLEKLKTFHKSLDYRSQIRSIILIRRSLFQCNNLLSVIREAISKNKKLKAVKSSIQNATSKLIQEYYHSILSFRWTEKPSKTGLLVSRRDELMERQLEMDGKQAKRVISKYQNMHKL